MNFTISEFIPSDQDLVRMAQEITDMEILQPAWDPSDQDLVHMAQEITNMERQSDKDLVLVHQAHRAAIVIKLCG
jgi:hypothetical protein